MADERYRMAYAQLAPGEKALGCARELRRGQILRPGVKLVVSSTRRGHAELPLSLTHTWGGLLRGILLGGSIGLAGALLIELVEQATHVGALDWGPVVLFALLAALMGCIAGALVGSMNPIPKIEEMERDGDVFVAVSSDETKDLDWATHVLEKWGGRPELRAGAVGA
jgi:hypothetical protein